MEKQIRESFAMTGGFRHLNAKRDDMRKIDKHFDCGECNGYVAIPPEHPLHGASSWVVDDALGYPVHGGLTYANLMTEFLLKIDAVKAKHTTLPKDILDWYVYGFDTMHFDDTLAEWSKARVEKEALILKDAFDDYGKGA